MDKIDKGRRTEIGWLGVDTFREGPHLFRYEVFYRAILGLESLHERCTGSDIVGRGQSPVYGFVSDPLFIEGQSYLNVPYPPAIVCRVDEENRVAFVVGYFPAKTAVVMPHHDDVKTRNALSNLCAGIFPVFTAHGACLSSGMEKSDYDVGLLLLLDNRHPFTGGLFHVREIESAPKGFREPGWNSRSNHA